MEDTSVRINRQAFKTEKAYQEAVSIWAHVGKLSALDKILAKARLDYYIAYLNWFLCSKKLDKVCAGSIEINGWTKRDENNVPYKSYKEYSLYLNKDPEIGDILFYEADRYDLYEITEVKRDSCLGVVVIYKPFIIQDDKLKFKIKKGIFNWFKRK